MNSHRDCSVVAVFSNAEDAQNAAESLRQAGFKNDRIYTAMAAKAVAADGAPAESGRETGFTGWLKSLFGGAEHVHQRAYDEAFASGRPIVSVVTAEEDSGRASEILGRYSPVDVHSDDYAAAHGISTPNTDSATLEPGPADLLNAEDELSRPASANPPGISRPRSAVRVYPGDTRL